MLALYAAGPSDIVIGVVVTVSKTPPVQGREADGGAAGGAVGGAMPTNAGAPVLTLGTVGKLPPDALEMTATKPAASTELSDVNVTVSWPPVDVTLLGKAALPENPPGPPSCAELAEPPSYTRTKSYPFSSANELNCIVIGPDALNIH